MSSLFHSFKKTVFKGETHEDADFQQSKAKFDAYHDSLVRVKAHITSLNSHCTGVYQAGNSVTQEFTKILEDGTLSSDQKTLLDSSRKQHTVLSQDNVEKVNNKFQAILKEVDGLISKNLELNKNIVDRNKAFEEQGYYQKKVNELLADKETRQSKGKQESASDVEKLDRNQKKLSEVQMTFLDLNNKINAEFTHINSTKVDTLIPILNATIKEETNYCEMYAQALNQIETH